MRQTTLILAALVLFAVPVLAQDKDTAPEPTQRADAPYRLFRSQNIYTLLKLDTRTGQIWQVQWGDSGYRLVEPINLKPLAQDGKAGRFTLVPTQNIYTFILLDQENGKTWQVQWSLKEDERFIITIP